VNNYHGTIIEESLENKTVLNHLKIVNTRIENVTKKHQTPWLLEWTLHTVEIKEKDALKIAEEIRHSLDTEHNWYADYKNKTYHYIIFRGKIFKIERDSAKQYAEVKKYGIALGIPEHQVDFSPGVE